jgi:hypothetical protein
VGCHVGLAEPPEHESRMGSGSPPLRCSSACSVADFGATRYKQRKPVCPRAKGPFRTYQHRFPPQKAASPTNRSCCCRTRC